MRIIKRGILFSANYSNDKLNSALQPTPLITGENAARVFCGARDEQGISRVYAVDIVKDGNRLVVKSVGENPALSAGLPGTFDDNGVVPSAIVNRDGKIFLYYAGYQLAKNVRFLVLGGLAISEDGGNSFNRLQNTPVLERTDSEFLFRVPHTVFFEHGKWRVWYGGGSHFEQSENKTLPVYDIRYMESPDGIVFPSKGTTVLENGAGEYRIGRPYVFKRKEKYFMFFGASRKDVAYRLMYATSADGYDWTRQPDIGMQYEAGEFDSDMSAYPSVLQLGEKTYMLYNGNEYGKAGFGYAEIEFE